jgi:hypothetical protein
LRPRDSTRRILELTVETFRLSPSEAVGRMAQLDEYGSTFGYTLRSVRDGGALIRSVSESSSFALLEPYTRGLLTDSRPLDE